MDSYPTIEKVFYAIIFDVKFQKITNRCCVYIALEQFIIEDYTKAEANWQLHFDNYVVRTIALLYEHKLLYSDKYTFSVGVNCLVLKTDERDSSGPWYVVNETYRNTLKQIEKLLYCETKSYEGNYHGFYEMKTWIYPNRKVAGLSLPIVQGAIWIKNIVDFANDNHIGIKQTTDEVEFMRNPEVKEKLKWESFLFNYHKGVCFFMHAYSNFDSLPYYIMKVPEFPPHIINKAPIEMLNWHYITIEDFDDWKEVVLRYIKEREELNEFYYLMNKDEIDRLNEELLKEREQLTKSSESDSVDDNPYYRWDIEDDEQSIEFWDSI